MIFMTFSLYYWEIQQIYEAIISYMLRYSSRDSISHKAEWGDWEKKCWIIKLTAVFVSIIYLKILYNFVNTLNTSAGSRKLYYSTL